MKIMHLFAAANLDQFDLLRALYPWIGILFAILFMFLFFRPLCQLLGVVIIQAEGDAQSIKLNAAADAERTKLVAQAEAERISKTGAAEAGKILAIGKANAEAYELQVRAMGGDNFTRVKIAETIGRDKVKIIPDILITGSGGDSTNGPITSLLGLKLMEELGRKNEAPPKA